MRKIFRYRRIYSIYNTLRVSSIAVKQFWLSVDLFYFSSPPLSRLICRGMVFSLAEKLNTIWYSMPGN